MTFVKNNYLKIGLKEKNIKKYLKDIFEYIYQAYELDIEKMQHLYEHIESYDNHTYYFQNNSINDSEYVYRKKIIDLDNLFRPNRELFNESSHILIEEINTYLLTHSEHDLIIKDFTKILLINNTGPDERKSKLYYLDQKLHFWPEYIMEDKITFHDLIIAAYKIKSHKFETWFEMFAGVLEVHIEKHYNPYIEAKKQLTIVLKYDHGS
ncbi:hypothetical protein QKC54_gp0816 [Megavirus baoshan]|uniref:Uncharacterized protein n=1 Tax=Megavirus baoshan TaxID=2496520 RepID=A0A3Q8U8T5_9VIRU|nr:hypothetical protein QKC54_gp0816 [Megavirus baoshan]AZL89928.1 hypothetical protein Mb0256 [Megavirus baoshan]